MQYCLYCNLPLTHKGKFCNQTCQHDLVFHTFISAWLAGGKDGKSGHGVSAHIHRYIRELRGEKCENCGWSFRHSITNNIPLELDHINGKWDDNRLSNLRLLCPNCHALTPTYRALNIGNGDSARYKNKPKKEKLPPKLVQTCTKCKIKLKSDAVNNETGFCQRCLQTNRRTYEVSEESLRELIITLPMTHVAKIFGVTDNAVRKRCRTLGISLENAKIKKYKVSNNGSVAK